MKKVFFLSILLTSYLTTFGQSNSRFGFTFLDKSLNQKKYLEKKLDIQEKKQKLLIQSHLDSIFMNNPTNYYWKQYNILDSLITNSSLLNDYGKSLCYYLMSNILIYKIFEDNNNIYNSSNYLFNEKEEFCQETYYKSLSGANKIINLLDSAIVYSIEDRKEYLYKYKLYYLENSYMFQATLRYYIDCVNFNICEIINKGCKIKNLSSIINNEYVLNYPESRNIFKVMSDSYEITKFNPGNCYLGLNMGLNLIIGAEYWIGGELSIEDTSHRNPFEKKNEMNNSFYNSRLSFFGVNFNKSQNSDKSEFSLFLLRITNLGFYYINIFQTGFQKGAELPSSYNWFYKPEIGFTRNIFSLSVSYNLMFEKKAQLRSEAFLLNIKLSYPFIRLSSYE